MPTRLSVVSVTACADLRLADVAIVGISTLGRSERQSLRISLRIRHDETIPYVRFLPNFKHEGADVFNFRGFFDMSSRF